MVDIVITISYETRDELQKRAKAENKTVKQIAKEILAKETNTRVDAPTFKPYK